MPLSIVDPLGESLGERSEVVFENPKKLVNPKRLDIAVKVAFCRKLRGQRRFLSTSNIEHLYACHIEARTGGVEPNSIYRKNSTDDYQHFLKRIFSEIQYHGFDPSEPIQVSGTTGMILNGAHRLAAALALGLDVVPVVYDNNNAGREWGLAWFLDNGFSKEELIEIAQTYIEIADGAYNLGLIWPSDTVDSNEVIEALSEQVTLFHVDAIEPGSGMKEFIFDTYAHDYGVTVHKNANNIIEKAERLSSKQNGRVMLVAFACNDVEHSVKLRDQLRKQFAVKIDGPAFDLIHVASTQAERAHLKELLLSPATLNSYNYRHEMSDNLTTLLDNFDKFLKKTDISRESACIVGGAVLDLYRFKTCDDIDFVMPYRMRRRKYDDRAHELSEGIDLASYNYARELTKGFTWTDDDLVQFDDLHTMARGYRFAHLNVVLERKRWSQRRKDKPDVSNISRHRLGTSIPQAPVEEPAPELASTDYNTLVAAGRHYHKIGELHTAARAYRTLTELFPDKPLGWTGLGICALQRGDNGVARSLFETATKHGEADVAQRYLAYLNDQPESY